MVIVLLVRRELIILSSCLVLEYHCLNGLRGCSDGANEAKYGIRVDLALAALDVALVVVFKGGSDAHESFELFFPFLRRELRLEVAHIPCGDDTTKMDEITAQRDDILRLRLLVLDGVEQKSGDGNSRSARLGYITIPPKPQQPVETVDGLARTAGFGSIAKLGFAREPSAQLTCSGRMECHLVRARQDLNLDYF